MASSIENYGHSQAFATPIFGHVGCHALKPAAAAAPQTMMAL
jgi:hypothetical protein